MKKFFFINLLIFINTIFAFGQGGNTTLVGRWAAGPPYSFTVEDNIVYTASGGILQILDISNPSDPQLIGQVSTNGIINDVAKSGNYVYLAEGDSGCKIINVSNIANPVQVGEISLPGPVKRVIGRDQILYVAEGEYYEGNQLIGGGVRLIDVSDLQNIELLSFVDTPNSPNYMSLIGQFIYVDGYVEYPRTYIIVVSNPLNPLLVGFLPHQFGNAELSGNLLFVAAPSFDAGGIKILNVANPWYPSLLSQIIFPGGGKDIVIQNQVAFVTNSRFWNGNRYVEGRIWSFDISDPNYPVELSFYDSPGYVASVGLYEDWLIVSEGLSSGFSISEEGSGLRLIDISNPVSMQPIGFIDMPGLSTYVVVRDKYAFVSTLYGGISIVDVQDFNNPIQIGYYNSPGSPRDLVLQDNYAYLVELNRGLRVIDIADLTNPVEVGNYDIGATFSKIDVSGDQAFILNDGTMKILDISNLANITEISSTDFGYSSMTATSLIVDGNFVYISLGIISHWGAGGLIITYDVSNPENPVQIGLYSDGGIYQFVFYPLDMSLRNNYLFVMNEYGGLRIFDVSDPTNLVVVSNTPTFGDEIDIYQNFAFLSKSLVGINIFDISDPFNPTLVETYNEFWRINSLTLDNKGKIYTASAEYGMMIFKNDLVTLIMEEEKIIPSEFSLKQNYPNPFNPATKISYSIPSGDYVTLKVYDILGNEISTLVSEEKLAGNYEIDFNGSDLASGVYLYVLRYDNNILSKKMMLLK